MVRMRFLSAIFLFWVFQANASFTIYVVDAKGTPVADAVLSLKMQTAGNMPENNQAVAVMDQIGMQFAPYVLVVSKNQLVSFPNSDDTRHHVYSFSTPKIFELKLYKGVNSESVVMETPGIVELGCNIHDQMIGFIYVDDTATALKTDENGRVTFKFEQPESIMVWHPRLHQATGTITEYPLNKTNRQDFITLVIDIKPLQTEVKKNSFKRRFKHNSSGTSQ